MILGIVREKNSKETLTGEHCPQGQLVHHLLTDQNCFLQALSIVGGVSVEETLLYNFLHVLMLYSAYNLQGDENSTPYLHEVVSVGELVSFVVLGGVDDGWMVLELELLGIASYLRE